MSEQDEICTSEALNQLNRDRDLLFNEVSRICKADDSRCRDCIYGAPIINVFCELLDDTMIVENE